MTISTHHIQGIAIASTANSHKIATTTTTTSSNDARSHVNMSMPFQQLPAAAAYVFHDIGKSYFFMFFKCNIFFFFFFFSYNGEE